VCDLERRRIVALLPDREIATVRAWLFDHPEIKVVSRDSGGGYGDAAAKALPDAIRVADRWHLMENASAAFLGAVRRLRQSRICTPKHTASTDAEVRRTLMDAPSILGAGSSRHFGAQRHRSSAWGHPR